MSLACHRWIAKAVIQKTASKLRLLPVYHRAQQLGGRLKNFHPSTRIEYAGKLAADIGLEKLQGATAIEIGTGWVPVMPIALKLLGVNAIHSFDLTRHLQKIITMRALSKFDQVLEELARRSGASLASLQTQFEQLKGVPAFGELARRMDFHYHAPMDFTQYPIRAKSVDLIYSNLVLEHVTPNALRRILRRSREVLKPGGVCWHNVDYTDHYAATHAGMSPANFLRYSEGFWNAVGQNDILYQNRLRRSDYTKAFVAAGFEIVHSIDHVMQDDKLVDKVPLAPEFSHRPATDILGTSSRFVLRAAEHV